MKKLLFLVMMMVAPLVLKAQFTVYYSNPNNWSTVNIHYWGGSSTDWPGVTMSSPAGNSPWYSYSVPDGVTNMLFHNTTGSQTSDLTRSTTGYFDGTTWFDTNPYELLIAPILTGPSDGATGVSVTPTLSWNSLDYADSYLVEVDDNSDFSSTIVSATATSPYLIEVELTADVVYFWRVKATNYTGDSPWSSRSFTTAAVVTISSAPTLTSPVNNAIDQNVGLTLSWDAVDNATDYRVQVSTTSDFNTTVINTTTTSLLLAVTPNLVFSTEYFWRVRGEATGLDDGPYSTENSFITRDSLFTVYYSNPNSWSTVNIHYWGGATATSWPGIAMTTPVGNSPWYSYSIPVENTNMLFHNTSGSQTSDLTRSTTGYFNGTDWSDTDPFILSTGPTLTSPSDEATDIGVNTTLAWDALENATAYIIVIDDNNDFTSPLDSTVATSPFDPTGLLAVNTTYYWKVRGNNYAGNSDWTYASFSTEGLNDGISIADGDWSSTSTWSNGVVPANIDVNISLNVTLDQSATVSNITIEADKTLNGSSNTLSIEDGGIFTNNGTFTYSTSTVHFLGDGSVAGSSTSDFYNLIIDGSDDDSDYGGSYIPNTSTINGILTIATGGYLASSNGGDGITSNSELPNYASGAGLAINGPFTVSSYASGWGDSGSKLPTNVNLGASGDVELTTLARSVSGLLTVQSNIVTTNGNLTILSGGSVEVLSGTISGDITFEQEITGTQGWRTLAAPVSSTTVQDLMSGLWSQGFTGASTTEGNANVRTYNGSAYVAPSNASDNITAGTGYAALIFADDNFEGEVEGFPKTISATGTVVTTDVDVTLNQGLDVLTLVGNPYLVAPYQATF